jgi:spermidine synthase
MSNAEESNWYKEYINPSWIQMVAIKDRLFSGSTAFQKVEVSDTESFGRSLYLDQKTQSTEADEFIYHEALVQPAMITHPNPKKVFIAGGGEGATLREVLSHNTVSHAVMVDLDKEVVEICERFLPNHHKGSFRDARSDIKFEDARKFLETSTDTYDVIILDLPDPQEGGPASFLYTKEFYTTVINHLSPDGLLSIQSECLMAGKGNYEAFSAIHNTLKSISKMVFPYKTMIPSFSCDWGFNLISMQIDPLSLTKSDVDTRILERGCNELRFYDGQTHEGLFMLPKYVREILDQENRIILDESPLVVF